MNIVVKLYANLRDGFKNCFPKSFEGSNGGDPAKGVIDFGVAEVNNHQYNEQVELSGEQRQQKDPEN